MSVNKAWIVLLMLGGCSLALPEVEFVQNACVDDSDCHDSHCDVNVGMCFGSAESVLQVGLEILPASDALAATPALIALDPITIYGPQKHDISLPPSITVAGTVRWSGHEGAVTADIVFVRPSTFLGSREARTMVTTSVADVSVAGYGGDYAVRVMANTYYDVMVRPTGEASLLLPPMKLGVDVPGGGDLWPFDIHYPDALAEVSGTVVNSSGSPVANLQVQAVTREGEEVISSTAVTAQDGSFAIHLLPENTSDYLLRLTGSNASHGVRAATFFDPAYAFPTGELVVLVPDASAVIHYEGTVEGPEGEQTALEGASLSFRSADVVDEVTNLVGRFETTAVTEFEGAFEAILLPGSYDILITPPAGSGASIDLLEGVQIERPTSGDRLQGQVFVLPAQPTLRGTVKTADGRAVRGATLEALALGSLSSEQETPAAVFNRSADAVTNERGRFDLPMDIGTYDLVVKPPSGSGFSWLVEPGLAISESGNDQREIELEAPIPFSGVLRDANGVPVVGAEISAFGLLSNGGGAARAAPLGRTETAEDGSYMLLLPVRL